MQLFGRWKNTHQNGSNTKADQKSATSPNLMLKMLSEDTKIDYFTGMSITRCYTEIISKEKLEEIFEPIYSSGQKKQIQPLSYTSMSKYSGRKHRISNFLLPVHFASADFEKGYSKFIILNLKNIKGYFEGYSKIKN